MILRKVWNLIAFVPVTEIITVKLSRVTDATLSAGSAKVVAPTSSVQLRFTSRFPDVAVAVTSRTTDTSNNPVFGGVKRVVRPMAAFVDWS